MVLITPQRMKDLLIERLQGDSFELDFHPFNMEQGDTCRFAWYLSVGEDDLIDINDIEFYMPEDYRRE